MNWLFILAAITSIVIMLIADQFNKNWGIAFEYFAGILTLILWAIFETVGFFYRRFSNPPAEKKRIKFPIKPAIPPDAKVVRERKQEPIGSADSGRDLILKRISHAGHSIEYQISAKDKAKHWTARCNVTEGNVRSIQLFSGTLYGECALLVTEEILQQKYTVKDHTTTIGSINVGQQRWEFYDTTSALIYTIKLETVVENEGNLETWLGAIVSNNGHFPGTTVFKYWFLQDSSGTTLGKYFIDLKNIDLTQDTDNRFDLRIAAAFAILADNSTVKNSA
jgi:hypothetical protein